MFPIEICKPSLDYLSLSADNILCVPWCKDDYDWTETVDVLSRCQDGQDRTLYDMLNSLQVLSTILDSHVGFRAASRAIQSARPAYSFEAYINDTDAYQYVVDMTSFNMCDKLQVCLDL